MNGKSLTVNVLTPEKELFSGETTGVKLPGASGSFEILNLHAPIISSLTEGKIRIARTGDSHVKILISRGFVECVDNEINVLVESGELES